VSNGKAPTPYTGRRDPRFVTVRRGGLLDDETHRSLALCAAGIRRTHQNAAGSARPVIRFGLGAGETALACAGCRAIRGCQDPSR
jgi:hypothetical protein